MSVTHLIRGWKPLTYKSAALQSKTALVLLSISRFEMGEAIEQVQDATWPAAVGL